MSVNVTICHQHFFLSAHPGSRQLLPCQHPWVPGQVTDDCARAVAATFIAHCENSNRLHTLCSIPAQRAALSAFAHETLGLTTRAALTTNEIPLPTQYGREIRELISEFGVVRRRMLP
jgi:hypothetical protein